MVLLRVKSICAALLLAMLSGCAVYQPTDTNDLCKIFKGETDWYEDAVEARDQWRTPIAGMMAIMHQESRFVAHAQPERDWFLWIIPLPRRSTAYGYAQAQDPVWNEYTADGHAFDVRDDFGDAINFIGWYMHGSSARLGIKKGDIYSQYLAYHEGRGGFEKRSFDSKPWLKQVASKVSRQAQRYQRQLKSCKAALDDEIDGWF